MSLKGNAFFDLTLKCQHKIKFNNTNRIEENSKVEMQIEIIVRFIKVLRALILN